MINFRKLFPLIDFSKNNLDCYTFDKCETLQEFLLECISIYKIDQDERVREGCLSVYMAFRDHYPSYLACLEDKVQLQLNHDIESANPKIIKLRRLAISAISKVA